MSKTQYWTGTFIFLGILILVGFLSLSLEESQVEEPDVMPTEVEITNFPYGIDLSGQQLFHGHIRRNEFLADILLPFDVDYQTIDLLSKKSKEVFDVRKLRYGNRYIIATSGDSVLSTQYFIYHINSTDFVIYDLRDSINITKGQREVQIKQKETFATIEHSLYESIKDSDADVSLAVRLSEVYAWSIDFYHLQKNDWFKVIYEELYVDNERIGTGEILAVNFNHEGHNFFGIRYEQDSTYDYFDEHGKSLRKAFLKAPLKFSRISSRYSRRRFHPVQKRWKAHLGTDYAAPTGTPIMATGDGVVVEATRKKYNGRYVKIKHNGVYFTQYLHMRRIGENIKPGVRVRQGDIIGYVGQSGLATGPHVCYRFWKNGQQVDPNREEFPPAVPIHEENMLEFCNSIDSALIPLSIKENLMDHSFSNL